MGNVVAASEFEHPVYPGITFRDRSLTKQADKESCDINYILDRFERTGQLPNMIRSDPRYGDFSSVLEFQNSLDIVLKAQEQFDALPAKVRDRFGNDPAQMLAFCADEKNVDEMIKLGLAVAKEVPLPPKQEATTPAAAGNTTPDA